MEKTAKTIGELIQIAVTKSGMTITDFADKIGCTRENYYKIIKKNNLDIQLIKNISEVLKHDFFKELSNNFDLATSQETKEERANREALAIFTEIVPKVLREMNIDNGMFYWRWDGDKNDPKPDWALCAYSISFTIGQKMAERYNDIPNHLWIKTLTSPNGVDIEQFTHNQDNFKFLNITIRKRTEEEWKRLLEFAINYAKQNGYRYNTTHQHF